MVQCVAIQCKSRPEKKEPGVTFHRFPTCEETRKQWIKNLQIEDWSPASHHRVCSKHFEDMYFYKTKQKTKLLLDAVPTIFDKVPNSSPNEPERKRTRVIDIAEDSNVPSTEHEPYVVYLKLEPAQEDPLSSSWQETEEAPLIQKLQRQLFVEKRRSTEKTRKIRVLNQSLKRSKRTVVALKERLKILKEENNLLSMENCVLMDTMSDM